MGAETEADGWTTEWPRIGIFGPLTSGPLLPVNPARAEDAPSARLIACYGHVPDFAKRQRCMAGETSDGEATAAFDIVLARR